ncbi:galactosylgalactosylxylosylprotein 3-beta-glucuronosyltransferase P-like [Homarus americanus]|uniref:galactosylgalactosylxylosylprotein 3-beta-glucuronosyltransferase P-like n=1 Tax=Homarus americanus TaxID=6706 RepID=UPI001C465BD3|nr:galactosylgalactosylxylosylprotein 3-beta-glucuronosyltransferase P-like [Homarus americanus]
MHMMVCGSLLVLFYLIYKPSLDPLDLEQQQSTNSSGSLWAPMPNEYKKLRVKPRGVANRNAGLQWVRTHAKTGVVYFADDDNTYDIRVFEEMRYTKGVSMWPVGLVTHTGISTPVLKNGKFVGWYDGSINSRKFPVDMACFAFSVSYLLQVPEAIMPFKAGREEDGFLTSLKIKAEEIEFKADLCTKVI